MRIDWAAQVLTDAKLTVVEEEGWTTRGRELAAKPLGVIIHHDGSATGGKADASVIRNGRADVPGPLSQFYLSREGVWHVVASGKANHAGDGYYNGINKGNSNLLGVEAANDGEEDWPDVQFLSYVKGVAALLNKLHAPSLMAFGHKEWAPRRKPDPTFDMNAFRALVRLQMGELFPRFPGVVQRRITACRGTATSWIRYQLVRQGYEVTHGDTFDQDTEKAVNKMRKRWGMKEDGTVDAAVWLVLGFPRI